MKCSERSERNAILFEDRQCTYGFRRNPMKRSELNAILPGVPENRIGFGVGVLLEDRRRTTVSEGTK